MDDAAALLQIESIKQLKARYCRYLDTKDWASWRDIFADDFRSDTASAGGKIIVGADPFVAFTRKSLGDRATVHQVHAPGIELTSATTARRVGPRGRRAAGPRGEPAWLRPLHRDLRESRRARLITSSKLTRLREDVFNVAFSLYISDWIKRLTATVARRLVR